MTVVSGDLKIVTGVAQQVSEVWARAARSRPVAGGWLLENAGRALVTAGRVEIDLHPGPCVLVAVIGGQPAESVELIVPDGATATLEACVRAAEGAGGLERDGLDELRAEIGAWFEGARESAAAAKVSETAAGASATKAKASESNAKTSETKAKTSETNAKTSETNARASETKAKASETAAASSASSAKADADRAAGVASSTSWSGDRLTVNGQTSPALTGPRGPAGSSAWADITGKPDLSTKADLVGGKVPTSQIPAVALTKPQVVEDRSAMLKLTAEEGDVAVITSGVDKGTYMLGTGAASVFASWVRLASPDGAVSSVNGQTGVVNLSAADVGGASATHTHTLASITDAPNSHTSEALPSSLMSRDASGRSKVFNPEEFFHVANKGYVDQRTPEIKVVSAMPSNPDASTLYVVVG